MTSLYNLTEDMLSLQEALCELGGELTDEMVARLDGLEGNLMDKSDDYAQVYLNLSSGVTAKKEEIKRLQTRVKVEENAVDGLKERIKSAMVVFDKIEIQTDLFHWKIVNNGGVLGMNVDEDSLDKEFIETVTTTKPNEEVNGASLKERGTNLRLK